MDHNGLVTTKEIREYYESHPNKMSKEGIEFIDRNFHSGGAVDVDGEIFNFFRSVLCLSTSESL